MCTPLWPMFSSSPSCQKMCPILGCILVPSWMFALELYENTIYKYLTRFLGPLTRSVCLCIVKRRSGPYWHHLPSHTPLNVSTFRHSVSERVIMLVSPPIIFQSSPPYSSCFPESNIPQKCETQANLTYVWHFPASQTSEKSAKSAKTLLQYYSKWTHSLVNMESLCWDRVVAEWSMEHNACIEY